MTSNSYKLFTFKSLAPTTASIPLPTIDTSSLSVDKLDAQIWPTQYLASRSRSLIASKLAPLLKSLFNVDFEDGKLFAMLERTKRDEHGHYCFPVPQLKLQGVNPVQAATDLAQAFSTAEPTITASTSGPFVNFRLDSGSILREAISEALSLGQAYGFVNIGHGKRIGVDYSSPNIAKPFHAGHLRSTIIGNFIKMVYAANGFETLGINYLGDWGKQYGLLAIGFERHGSEDKLQADPIKHLFDVYVQINRDIEQDPSIDDAARAYFKGMEQGDEKALALWQRFRDLSISKYKQVYARLNVEFELYSGESLYQEHMPGTIKQLTESGLTQCTQGAYTIDLGAMGKALIMKKDGATLYMTRDIAAAQHRFTEMHLDKSIYVVAMQQDLHLAQLFKIIEMMAEKGLVPPQWSHLMQHVNFGMVKGMKTRKGEVVFLEDILDEARDVMHGVMQSNPEKYAEVEDPLGVSDALAVSAIVVQDMAAKRIKDYDFKLERVTQFEGDTGPYLQYAHSRLCSIERKSGISVEGYDISLLVEKETIELAWHIARFPEVIQEARISHEPCNIVSYLMALSQCVSQCLQKLWVMGQAEGVAKARLALYKSARMTLGNGLRLIGLKPLERM